MSKVVTKFSRLALLSLLIALLLTNTLILAPAVGAASDTNKTETIMNSTDNIPAAEDDVLTQRAITMDEAKKEAQAAVSEQLAIIAAVEEKKAEDVIETQTSDVEVDYEPETDYVSYAQSSSTTYSGEKAVSTVQESYSYGFLMDIDNPDPNYVGYTIALTDTDRDMAERIVMGEAGSTGFTGMALVAQCLRDTYIAGGYSSIADVIYDNGYYGSMSITPSSTCREVISYIFDQGGSAVQHTIRVFYASNYCSSPWHEAQQYVCSYGYVRYFDM